MDKDREHSTKSYKLGYRMGSNPEGDFLSTVSLGVVTHLNLGLEWGWYFTSLGIGIFFSKNDNIKFIAIRLGSPTMACIWQA